MSVRAAPFDPVFFERDSLFWPIAPAASAFASFTSFPPIAEYGARVRHRAPVTFREQPKKPRRRREAVGPRDLYDGRIVEEGWVPTRPSSWHDFLNMLVWATFPEAKWQLHVRQHRARSARITRPVLALPNARTREEDALALLDEGGVVVLCREGAEEEARGAFAERRAAEARALVASGDARVVIFGHAVYEELVYGRKGGWCAGFFTTRSLDSADPGSLTRSACDALATELSREGSFESPAALTRVDLPLLRDS